MTLLPAKMESRVLQSRESETGKTICEEVGIWAQYFPSTIVISSCKGDQLFKSDDKVAKSNKGKSFWWFSMSFLESIHNV